jgi:hypothetical protein
MVCHGLKMLQSVKEKLLEKEKAKAAEKNINAGALCASPSRWIIYILCCDMQSYCTYIIHYNTVYYN